ncbi:MAG TPA: ABC transporter substrate-binding protein [Victivallales bacterium]|nr:ABC transporter substrate-binding protein [Victivallales bacterium]
MFRKLIVIVLAIVTCIGMTSLCSAANKRIYLIPKANSAGYWQTVIDGAQHAAKKYGVDLIVQGATSEIDVTRQISIVENALVTHPAAIILAPTSTDSLVPVIEKASREKVPVIIIDSKANTKNYKSFMASDNVKIGELAADQLAQAIKEKTGKIQGDVAGITFLSGASSLEQRKKGFLNRIKEKYPKLKVVDFRDALAKSTNAIDITQNYLTKYPELKGIFCNNNYTTDGAARTLYAAHKKNIALIGVDSDQQEIWGLKNGYIKSIIVQKPWIMGYMGVEYAIKAINGKKIPKYVNTGVVAITKKMIISGKAEQFLNPVKYYKTHKIAI